MAYHIIGGGEEGDKAAVHTKEEADHSLPYMLSVAALDGQVMPEQYSPERIMRADVRALMRRVTVRSGAGLSQRFPDEMPCRLLVRLHDGTVFTKEKRDYEGFHTRPMSWDSVAQKFDRLSEPHATPTLRAKIVETVARLDATPITDLLGLMAKARVRAQ